jgi:hypothetical protein
MEFAADDFEAIAKAMKPSTYDLPKDQLPKKFVPPYDWDEALLKKWDEAFLKGNIGVCEVFVPYFNQPESD